MKPIELIQFVEQNAQEISSKEDFEQEEMMTDMYRCVLRPFSLPPSLKNKMTWGEFAEYREVSTDFTDITDIPKAVAWLKEWVQN